MLVELGLVEQRYQAVLEVLNDGAAGHGRGSSVWHGAPDGPRVAPVSTRSRGFEGWRIGRHGRCRVRIRWTRWSRPGWWRCAVSRPRLGAADDPVLARARECGAVARSHVGGAVPDPPWLVTPQARRRKRSDYKRWECSRSMELWQTDIVGGPSGHGGEAKIVSGIDDQGSMITAAS